MKLSNETIAILKNFQTINTNIILYPGKTLFTQSVSLNVFSMHEIEEDIPQQIHIYDLPSLLGVLSLCNEPDIEFHNDHMTISNQHGGSFQYFYSDPSVVHGPPNQSPRLESVYTFDISKEEIQMIKRASGIISATTLSITTVGNDVVVSLSDPKTPSSNLYKKIVGSSNGLSFDMKVPVSDLKMMDDSYSVSLTTKKFLEFRSKSKNYVCILRSLANSVI